MTHLSHFTLEWWIYFNIFLAILLAVDLKFITNRTLKQSYIITAAWITLAGLFAALLYATKGPQICLEFTTGYLIEKSLSVDNLFVFLTIFHFFHVPNSWKQRILMYGILGALVMRFIFIMVGITLIQKVHWILLVFGAFLVVTGILMFKKRDKITHPKQPPVVTFLKRFIPCIDTWENKTFFIRKNGKLLATPAFLVLCAIETTDLVFALDSIPAVFAITLDPFIVYSCNALAIIGLRSLFFVLKDLLEIFEYLHYGVSLILVFVGCKMLIAPFYTVDTVLSLAVIGTILITSILGSYIPHSKGKS